MEFNEMILEIKENTNLLGKINLEYTEKLGKDHYMAKLSNTFVNSLLQFEKFFDIMNNRESYALELLRFSQMAIDVFKITPPEFLASKSIFKKRKILKKNLDENRNYINKVLDQMDLISAMIDENVKNLVLD